MSDFSAWLEKNKALWTRVYDEVIGPDLEEEWKKRDEAHEKELKDSKYTPFLSRTEPNAQKEDVKRQALSNHLEDQVVENSRLRSENEELKKKLEDLSSNALSKINSDQAATGASTASDMDLADKFNDLTKKYQDLSQKIRYLERKNSTVMQKNKDMKESAPNPSSSQTTEDESAEQISRQTQFTAGDEDDMPEFVSARPLKRKRGQPSKLLPVLLVIKGQAVRLSLNPSNEKMNIWNTQASSGEEPPPADENTSRLAPLLARAKLNRKLHDSTNLDGMGSAQLSTHMPVKIKVEQNPTPPRSSAGATPASLPKKRDFKPNPAYNQGYTYAFSETVRKRGDRACLPGCTNPDCCGSTFRTFAEVQAPLPASQEDALLEDYLGEAYDNMNLTQMSAEERQELVLQARTKKMAKEAGKHREAYERRRTPPGFWRMDFPTTQEQQEDRDKSKEQEKRVVHERWLEAQRKGGKWLYRDE
ncbi:hypothetical protein SNOG_01248 [Parastagonospora nodorum SN15]|uniref:DNA endonuclease activator Ctp1 C-terminal domain-containing protein n=1 Tax=Phaeosphaeria nodorum (strain SN15 / ATCC MYA-4574 / FGSC 10173) TaxID=321614 RepID=Q0V416_PHANO|nr:hypothetical protein SNOG_01248 [Parastagonospora nodorum SN15]EAT90897.2 hypothetical protein SNOG_01248 [Parastagonospora nodorum SN15]